MKKILTICLMAYATLAVAQSKSSPVDSLIQNKHFTFIVTEVKQAGGMRNTTPPNPIPENVNAAAVSMAQRQEITSMQTVGAGEYVQREYDRLNQIDASYSPILSKNSLSGKDAYAIYFIQKKEQLVLNEAQTPSNVIKLKKGDFSVLSDKNYEFSSVKKSNGKWLLTYHVKGNSKKQTFYLDVTSDGKATLTTDATTVLAGYLVPSA